MEKPGVGTPSAGQASPGRKGRKTFPCPSCGGMLLEGAILCPHCETDFRTPADEASAPSIETGQPIWGGTRPASTSEDRLGGVLSLGLAAITLVTTIVLSLTVPGLIVLWSALASGAGVAFYAIHLARRAVGRLDNTSDKQGVMTAQWGIIIGWATITYAAFVFGMSMLNLMFSGPLIFANNVQ
jgi:hypothetical protein